MTVSPRSLRARRPQVHHPISFVAWIPWLILGLALLSFARLAASR